MAAAAPAPSPILLSPSRLAAGRGPSSEDAADALWYTCVGACPDKISPPLQGLAQRLHRELREAVKDLPESTLAHLVEWTEPPKGWLVAGAAASAAPAAPAAKKRVGLVNPPAKKAVGAIAPTAVAAGASLIKAPTQAPKVYALCVQLKALAQKVPPEARLPGRPLVLAERPAPRPDAGDFGGAGPAENGAGAVVIRGA